MPQLDARIQSFELAYRMQIGGHRRLRRRAASRSTMLRRSTAPASQARQILIARRLVERGVRFVQVWHGDGPAVGQSRRHRGAAPPAGRASATRPIGALLTRPEAARHARRDAGDLGRRVRPHADGRAAARRARTPARSTAATTTTTASRMWLAGGGVKGGYVHGATDEFGFRPWRTKSTSTTCTPRCCTCSASTTRSSPTATPAATSA